MFFDHVSKPATGRYFPYSAGELARRAAGLTTHWATDTKPRRIDLHLKNCLVECDHGHQLCTFNPRSYIASFSLPDLVAVPLARRAVDSALRQFAQIDRSPCPSLREQHFVVYRAFIGALGEMCITEHPINGQGMPWRHVDAVLMLSRRGKACKGQRVVFRACIA